MITDSKQEQAIKQVNSNEDFKVEGLHYVLIRKDRYEDMLDLYRDHFYPDEPPAQSVGLVMGDELRNLMRERVQENISIALISDATGDIVGGRIIKIENRNDTNDVSKLKSAALRTYVDLMNELDRRCNVYSYYGVDEIIHFNGICVHPEYRRQGIGEKLMRAAVYFVSHLDLGDVIIKGEGSSVFSQRVFEKIGFDILSEVVYDDYQKNGSVVARGKGEHNCERM